MEEAAELRNNNRNRVITDLKSFIKQVYHEAVNHELSPDNVTYITQSLIKRIDETLLFGLKQPQLGYWKIVQKILHPDSLNRLTSILGFGQSAVSKGRTWIALSLLDDALVSYINCFVLEKLIAKVYEDWSVIRNNDACNSFLSLLSGIESVSFRYEVIDAYTLPHDCILSPRLCDAGPPPWSPPPSLTDSGVQLDRSDDYLNGNLLPPAAEPAAGVVLRRRSKAALRHVSFHEDSLAKSPSQRKLRWDVENSRYSWAGEELDALRLPGLRGARSERGERGAPEGEEAPTSVPDLRPIPVSVPSVAGRRTRRLSTRKFRYDRQLLTVFTQHLDAEVARYRRAKSIHDVQLPEKLAAMLGVRGERRWSYKLWAGKVIVITTQGLLILHKDLTAIHLTLPQIEQVVLLPHGHEVHILTRKQTHVLTCGDWSLSHEILTRLAYQLHVAKQHQVCFRLLHPSDMYNVKQELVNRRVLTWADDVLYLGLVRQQVAEDNPSFAAVEKQGSVMYLTATSQSWRPANMVLRGGSLYLYEDTRSPQASINLMTSCVACDRSYFSDRPHTFSLTLKQSESPITELGLYHQLAKNSNDQILRGESALRKWTNIKPVGKTVSQWVSRAFSGTSLVTTAVHIAAADEYQMSDWLQTLLTVFCQGKNVGLQESEANEATLLVTDKLMVLLTHTTGGDPEGEGFQVLGSAVIRDISTFRVGSHPHDAYCIIEFECQEAGSAMSDWMLHFGSRAELDGLLSILQSYWSDCAEFPLDATTDSRCERIQDCLTREWFA